MRYFKTNIVKKIVLLLAGVVSWTVLVQPAYSHHAIFAHFDQSIPVDIQGEITEVKLVNPHSYLYLNVAEEDGSVVSWRCEMFSGNGMRRRGWDEETLSPGMTIRIEGFAARREAAHCLLDRAILDNGETLTSRSVVGESSLPALSEATDPLVNPSQEIIAERPNFSGYWKNSATINMGPPQTGGAGRPPAGGAGRPPGGGAGGPPAGAADRLPTMASPFITVDWLVKPSNVSDQMTSDYEFIYDNPALHCHPTNILFGLIHDAYTNRFEQTESELKITFGYMDFERVIDFNRSGVSGDVEPSTGGQSVTYMDGETLVVQTTGFEPGYLIASDGAAIWHGENMVTIERFAMSNDRQMLTREYVAVDPEYFVGGLSGTDQLERSSEPYVPFNCTELSGVNNQRPE